MTSRSERNKEFLAMFGTPFEELDESEGASKKPLSVENQIVTDEKGRRRFHGAFTGGFSAGYFNTVGTKEGWAPSTFKSTRSKREEQKGARPEDFMDTEDFSEYGIAPRQIKTTQAFTEDSGQSTSREKRRFAGESTADVEAIADRLSVLVRPVSDSVGVRLMRSMGWRPGKGVGSAQTALIRDRAKGAAKSYGCELPPGDHENVSELDATELDAMAPGFQFAPSDVDFVRFEPKADLHGLGYTGLNVERHLKSAKSLEKESALKTSAKQKKGIRGQAFGVGAFEDEDDDLYVTDDFSNYDFALGGSDAREKQAVSSGDFVVAANTLPPRQFFQPPKLPRDYTPSVPSSSTLKQSQTTASVQEREAPSTSRDQSRNVLQRANVLDESHSVWSLVSTEDRQRIEDIKAGRRKQLPEREEPKKRDRPAEPPEKRKTEEIEAPFQNDPKKRARFQDFVNYLKRGLCPPQPPDLTEWDWEIEQIEFRKLLPSDLIAAEDYARSRQKPLAGTNIASAFSTGFKSKFTKASYAEDDADESRQKGHEDEDKVKAVQMKMFGAMTHEKHEWHPDKNLCKRFNLPNPYPESRAVGIPYLKKETRPGFFNFDFETVSTPSVPEDERRKPKEESEPRRSEKSHLEPSNPKDDRAEPPTDGAAIEDTEPVEAEEEAKAPMSLFKTVFAQTSSSSSDSEDEKEPEPIKRLDPHDDKNVLDILRSESTVETKKTETIIRQFSRFASSYSRPDLETTKEILEIDLDEPRPSTISAPDQVELGLYGPVLPPETSEICLPSNSVIRRHKHDKKRHRHKDRSHKKKAKSKDRKDKKQKKKKKSKRQSDESDSESDSESDRDGR